MVGGGGGAKSIPCQLMLYLVELLLNWDFVISGISDTVYQSILAISNYFETFWFYYYYY